MVVKVEIIGNAWGTLGIFMPVGTVMSVDEKQAELGVDMGVFKIVERTEKVTKRYVGKR